MVAPTYKSTPAALANLDAACRRVMQLWAPPPELTVSEWADAERKLSPESSAEPGQYFTSRAEFQRGIQNAFAEIGVRRVVAMTSSQVGKTTVLENVIAYHMRHKPVPTLLVMPTLEMGEAFSKDRLSPMIRDTPQLQGLVQHPRTRDSGNTLLRKNFPGGFVSIAGANSPSGLASRPIALLLCDEVDRYPPSAGTEGDPVALAEKRTTAFYNSVIGLFSTPGTSGFSRIESAYESSDQRLFYVPCPGCEVPIVLTWDGQLPAGLNGIPTAVLRYDEGLPINGADGRSVRTAAKAWMECGLCSHQFGDVERNKAVRRGKWQSMADFRETAGFWLWEGYSPFSTLLRIANDWLGALGNAEREKTFVNTALGRSWRERGEAPDWRRLYERAEEYSIGKPPDIPMFLTAGADVQKDRIEVFVWGWGRGLQSWMVDRRIVEGDPNQEATWAKLDEVLNGTYRTSAGVELPILRMGVDSGYATQAVYAWVRRQGVGRVLATKGQENGMLPLGSPTFVDVAWGGRKIRRGVKLWPIATGLVKSQLYAWLRSERPTIESNEPFPSGYVHMPRMDEEFFRQMTSEQLVTSATKQGFRKTEWQKMRERNEALDGWVIARAMASHVGIERFTERDWRRLDASFSIEAIVESEVVAQEPYSAPPPPQVRQQEQVRPNVIRSKWLNR